MTTTPLLESLCTISVDYWDDLTDELERAMTTARPIDTDVFAALDLTRAEWMRVYDHEKPRERFELGAWVYPLESERRLVEAACGVKRVLDELIADLVRKEVA
jgi:hypothetical protein